MNEQNGQVDIEAVKDRWWTDIGAAERMGVEQFCLPVDEARALLAHLERLEGRIAEYEDAARAILRERPGCRCDVEDCEPGCCSQCLLMMATEYFDDDPPAASSEEGGE